MYRKWLPFVLVILLAVCMPASQSAAASWSSFKLAEFQDISIFPQLGGSQTSYELLLGPEPTVTFGGATYDVNWIQSVYVVAEPQSGTFTATEGDNDKGWNWDDKDSPGQVAGYNGTGCTRLLPGESMTFSFEQFDAEPGDVLLGFHLGYQVGDSEYSNWFKGSVIPRDDRVVPEPTSIAALVFPVAGLAFYRRKRGF